MKTLEPLRIPAVMLVVASLLIGVGSRVQGSEELRDQFKILAEDILANTKGQPVTIGIFTGTGLPDTNSGRGLEAALETALKAQQPDSVKADAPFEVKGDYMFVTSKTDSALKNIKIVARLIRKEDGEELKESRLEIRLAGTTTLVQVLQATVALTPPNQPGMSDEEIKRKRNQEVQKATLKPSAHIHGPNNTFVSAADNSPFSVAILAGPASEANRPPQARPIHEKEGKPEVELEPNETYEIKIRNDSDQPIAASLSLDGVDSFHFQEPQADGGKFSHYIVAPHSEQIIPGWFKRVQQPDNYLAFLVTEYGKGAASQLGKPRGEVGIIHVTFANGKPLGEGQRAAAGNETGFGQARSIDVKPVRFEIEPARESVSVRYSR